MEFGSKVIRATDRLNTDLLNTEVDQNVPYRI